MTYFDFGVLIILVLSTLSGVLHGFIKEILSLVNLVVAFIVANNFGPEFLIFMDWNWVQALNPSLQILVACAFAFFMTLSFGAIFIMLMVRVVEVIGLGLIDQWLGAIFGLGRGVLIVLMLVMAAGYTHLPNLPFWREAAFSPLAVQLLVTLKPYMPKNFAEKVLY